MRISADAWDPAFKKAKERGDKIPNLVQLLLFAYNADPTATIVALENIRGGKA